VVVGAAGASASGSIRADARTTPVNPVEPAAEVLFVFFVGLESSGKNSVAGVSFGASAPPQAAALSQLSANVICTRVTLPMAFLSCRRFGAAAV
jgi:hypothetical protein